MSYTQTQASSCELKQCIRPWIICVSASLFFFFEFIQGNMFASIADSIMQDFHITANGMAQLSSVYYLANVLFLFVAGRMLDKYSAKMILVVAMFLCVASTFVLAQAESFSVAVLCRFVTGIGSAFCFLGPVRIAARWFPSRQMAMVTGIIVTIAMTGGMMAQYPLAYLVGQLGWRQALVWVGWFGMAVLTIMMAAIQDKKAQTTTQDDVPGFAQIFKQAYLNPNALMAASYTSLMNMAIAVFGAMMGSLYLTQRLGVGKEDAALINTFLFFGAIIGGPVMGYISDRLGKRRTPMLWGSFLSLLTVVWILYLPVSMSLMKGLFFLLGFFTAAQVISYAFVAENTSAAFTATALSVISILTQGGYVLYQNLFTLLLTGYGTAPEVDGVPLYTLDAYTYAAIILPVGLVLAMLLIKSLKTMHGKAA